MTRNARRQELYDRIRESSMDEVTLEEMVRHGFWPSGDPLPTLAEELVKRKGELQREIAEVAKDARAYQNADQALKRIMKDRMREAKERRIETKRAHIADRNKRAADWHDRKTKDVTHLGEGHAPALLQRGSDEARLATFGLPHFADLPDIAQAMGIDLGELRFLAYDRPVSKVTHYARFQVPKKTGGYRTISAPMPRMKRAQYWVLNNIVDKIEPHDAAHGFRAGRSIMSNAEPHAKMAVVMNYDLKDFFPSVGMKRVKGLFSSLGYAEAQATVFALLTTEADRTEVELDGQTWHVASGQRALPQGAPTSPAITNLLCRKLDRRLLGTARKLGFNYTRYADDLTFSRQTDDPEAIKKLDWSVGKIIRDEGFTLNDAKTRVMRRHQRQEVTGITVNDGLTVSRQERRKFRAYLHQTAKGKPTGSFRNGSPKNSALGYAQFLEMVHGPGVGQLTKDARAIFGAPERPQMGANNGAFRERAGRGEAPLNSWWTPALPQAPVPEPDPFVPKAAPKRSGASTNVPPVSQRQPERQTDPWGAAQSTQQTRATPVPQGPRKGLPWSSLKKVMVSLAIAIVAAPLPFSFVIVAFAVYYIWFRIHK